MRSWAIAVIAAACLTVPAFALPPAASDLRARIDEMASRDQPTDPKAFVAMIQPLWDEVNRTQAPAPDFAKVARHYALAQNENGNIPEAQAAIDAAIARLEAAGLGGDRQTALLLLSKGIYQAQRGDAAGSLVTKKLALERFLAFEGEDGATVRAVRSSVAFSLMQLGRLRQAMEYYALALRNLPAEDPNPYSTSTHLGNYAVGLRLMGDYDGSITAANKALDIARNQLPRGHRAATYALSNLATTLTEIGRYDEAEALYREAIDLTVETRGRDSYEGGTFTLYLATCLQLQGRDEEAEVLTRAALNILVAHPSEANPDTEALARLALAEFATGRGDPAAAEAELRRALGSLEPTGSLGDTTRAAVRTDLAGALLVQRHFDEALTTVDLALDYLRRETAPAAAERVKAESLRALILARLGRLDEALETCTPLTETLTTALEKGQASRSGHGLIDAYRIAFSRCADVAISAGHPDLAFSAAQRAAQSEITTMSQSLAVRAASTTPEAAELARRFQDTQSLRLRLDRERNFARGKSDDDIRSLDRQIAATESELADIRGKLNSVFPAFDSLSRPQPRTIADVAAGLAPGHALVLPLPGDDRLLTLVVTRDGLTWDSAPYAAHALRHDVAAVRTSIDSAVADSSRGFDRTAAWHLGRALLTPKIRMALKGTRELEFLGSGSLMSLPLGLLITAQPAGHDDDPRALRNTAWLIRDYAVSVKPALLATASQTAYGSGFLGIGAPALGPPGTGNDIRAASLYRGGGDKDALADTEALLRLPGLPNAKSELERMSRALNLPGTTLMLGEEATETRVKTADLTNYGVVAFATHGLTEGLGMHEPALVLTPPAQPSAGDDGLLTASDIAGLRLKARWVILSACNSGSGREAGAGGYSGLARAFMQAGTDSLLVSMWPVRDDIADRLSVDTVRRHARGDSQAEALRKAVLDLMKDTKVVGGANPAIWAPFSVVVR
ncbi:tetratricopeptide repeat family protein [Asticcacaulis biprosthecium C19]|uniref:Tetratricopeptide repeat family protein n=1 Tax=Asticcacaulis biprosthecium C19 TaxID=715226 RepID=F4QGF3_9CAUL|nr:CHAT domain-containing tetratricopeptide repeat protein [Asticcacaulis biprosthecium]EGF93634.1 tetratricopeptide repeat family protein [Asticcacaulis biprosthecium C19]